MGGRLTARREASVSACATGGTGPAVPSSRLLAGVLKLELYADAAVKRH